jgi:hypothetical protein
MNFPERFDLPNPNKQPYGNTAPNAKKRELILGAVIAVLSKFPDQCRAKGSSHIIVAKAVELIKPRSKSLSM